MRIVFNTNYKSAATFMGIDQLIPMLKKEGHEVARNDWKNYQNYDVVFFASPDSKVREAKKENPNILTGIIDPKTGPLWRQSLMKEVRAADFLLVSSIEHRDYFLKYNKNPFIYYFFPRIPKEIKAHTDKDKIIIGYHGNKIHLNSMTDVSWALDKLSEKYNIEFHAIYNIEKFGKWRTNRPRKCKVIDIQWTAEMAKDLKECDIGVAQSLQPIHTRAGLTASRYYFKKDYLYSRNDYLFRFKYSNGPGRIYPFAMLGIPVVADASPSQCQFIQNGVSGFICCTKEGWYNNLEKLIKDASLRGEQGRKLYDFVETGYSIEKIFKELMDFIKNV